MKTTLAAALLAGALSLAPLPARSLALGQVDTFQGGTTLNWQINLLGLGGSAVPPAVVASGGPAGAADAFLQLTSLGGSGNTPGGRLTALNATQWAGNYGALGITAIEMDLQNLGSSDLAIRLLFENAAGGPPTAVAITDAILLPAGSGWTHAVFAIDASSLTALLGSVADVLASTTILRIFHGPSEAFPGPPLVSQLGVDNILAAVRSPGNAVPEPPTLALLAFALLALRRARRRRIAA